MGLTDREYYREEHTGWHVSSGRSVLATLIVINVVVLVADLLFGGNEHRLAGWLMLEPADVTRPWLWWRFITYGFVHDPEVVGHIVLNMFVLYMFGQELEARYGGRRFTRFYLTAVVLCGIAWVARQVLTSGFDAPTRLLGASGAVTATFLLFVCLYPNRTILLFFVLPLPAWVVGVLFVLADLAGMQGIGRSEWGKVAFDVHLVGAAFGVLYSRYGDFWERTLSDWDFGKWLRRWRRPHLRVHRVPETDESDVEMEQRADALLDKVAKNGLDSLTAEERSFLENYSRKVRQRL